MDEWDLRSSKSRVLLAVITRVYWKEAAIVLG